MNDFEVGDSVLYIPTHVYGDKTHPDCEHGVVSCVKGNRVWVRYVSRQGVLQANGALTPKENLVKE